MTSDYTWCPAADADLPALRAPLGLYARMGFVTFRRTSAFNKDVPS